MTSYPPGGLSTGLFHFGTTEYRTNWSNSPVWDKDIRIAAPVSSPTRCADSVPWSPLGCGRNGDQYEKDLHQYQCTQREGIADEEDLKVHALARKLQCAVERRHSQAGANPAQQLSLQPVAIGADDRGNDIV